MSVTRDNTMDALKGVAILLVVLGHAVQSSYTAFDANPLFRLIYAFHMPLFMFLSGYVAFYGRDNQSWKQLRKKFVILVLPFVAWYGVSYVVTGAYMTTGLKSFVVPLILGPDHGLWFLWVLFLNFVLLAGALRLERYLKGWAIPLAWAALQLVPINYFGIALMKWHFAFFAIGFLMHRYEKQLASYRKPVAIMSLVAFPLLALFWHRALPPSFAGVLSAELSSLHAHRLYALLLDLYKYTVPLLGIFATWAVVSAMPYRAPFFSRALQWLGVYTLDIYVSHQYLLRFGLGEGPLHVLTAFVIALGGSLLISFAVLRRNDVLAHIFLGKPYAKGEAGVSKTSLTPRPTPLASSQPAR